MKNERSSCRRPESMRTSKFGEFNQSLNSIQHAANLFKAADSSEYIELVTSWQNISDFKQSKRFGHNGDLKTDRKLRKDERMEN